GKTRTAAELVRHWVETGQARRIGLIGATVADVRDTMIQGPSDDKVTRWQGDTVTHPDPGHLVTPSPCHLVRLKPALVAAPVRALEAAAELAGRVDRDLPLERGARAGARAPVRSPLGR